MLVAGDDGLVVAEQLMEGIKGPAVAALAASLASRLRRALEAAGVGAGQFWHLQAEQGALLVVTAPSGVLVVAVAEPDVNVGLGRLGVVGGGGGGGGGGGVGRGAGGGRGEISGGAVSFKKKKKKYCGIPAVSSYIKAASYREITRSN